MLFYAYRQNLDDMTGLINTMTFYGTNFFDLFSNHTGWDILVSF